MHAMPPAASSAASSAARTIIRLDPSHAGAYRALMLRAYDAHPSAFTTSAVERAGQPVAWWAARLSPDEDTPELVFGALRNGTLLGAAGLSFEKRLKSRHKSTLFGMVVDTAAQGQGLGRQLVHAVLAAARARPSLRTVQLTVTEGNTAAETLYRRCGFAPWGTEPMAVRVGDAYLGKVHLWCDLRG
ncbi:MAG: family N-acetyltransferase [Rhodoferax sp.]|nr:family N-acetyltransferase [Rhodoferax sp.]